MSDFLIDPGSAKEESQQFLQFVPISIVTKPTSLNLKMALQLLYIPSTVLTGITPAAASVENV